MTDYLCDESGDNFPSPKAAMLCGDRDLAEARDARRTPRHHDNGIIRSYD